MRRFYSNELVKQYREIFEKDILHCNPYTLEMFQGRTQKEKFMASIFCCLHLLCKKTETGETVFSGFCLFVKIIRCLPLIREM